MEKPKAFLPASKMRDLIKEDSSLILVLGRFEIPLGFGDKSVKEICNYHNVDANTFLEVINFVSNRKYNILPISLASLIGYLKKAHEYYLDFILPKIRRNLIEAIDCSGTNEIAMLIIKFYDEYVTEVRKHMEYEDNVVFLYVEQLLKGFLNREYNISTFAGKHAPIGFKLNELKDVIIRYYPEKNNYLLNAVLLDIIMCEKDLTTHCKIEDKLFVPAVKKIESQLWEKGEVYYYDNEDISNNTKDKLEVLSDREKNILVFIAKGLSNKEIADTLCISVHTVTTHRRNISGKLDIHTTAGLIIYAIVNNMIDINDVK